MAMPNVNKIIVDEYETGDVIKAVLEVQKTSQSWLMKAVNEQNLGCAGAALQAGAQARALLEALNEKLNGKKQPTVVQ